MGQVTHQEQRAGRPGWLPVPSLHCGTLPARPGTKGWGRASAETAAQGLWVTTPYQCGRLVQVPLCCLRPCPHSQESPLSPLRLIIMPSSGGYVGRAL